MKKQDKYSLIFQLGAQQPVSMCEFQPFGNMTMFNMGQDSGRLMDSSLLTLSAAEESSGRETSDFLPSVSRDDSDQIETCLKKLHEMLRKVERKESRLLNQLRIEKSRSSLSPRLENSKSETPV